SRRDDPLLPQALHRAHERSEAERGSGAPDRRIRAASARTAVPGTAACGARGRAAGSGEYGTLPADGRRTIARSRASGLGMKSDHAFISNRRTPQRSTWRRIASAAPRAPAARQRREAARTGFPPASRAPDRRGAAGGRRAPLADLEDLSRDAR